MNINWNNVIAFICAIAALICLIVFAIEKVAYKQDDLFYGVMTIVNLLVVVIIRGLK